jgi:hypothetical protein
MRADAHTPLETAREIHEPPAPDGFPPEEDPAAVDDGGSFLPGEEEGPPASLEMDLDEELASAESETTARREETDAQPGSANEQADEKRSGHTATSERSRTDEHAAETDRPETTEQTDEMGDATANGSAEASEEPEAETEIDEEELEEITAELEEQSEEIEQSKEQQSETDAPTDGETSGSLSEQSPATLEQADSSGPGLESSTNDSENTLEPEASEPLDLSDPDGERPNPSDERADPGNDEEQTETERDRRELSSDKTEDDEDK